MNYQLVGKVLQMEITNDFEDYFESTEERFKTYFSPQYEYYEYKKRSNFR